MLILTLGTQASASTWVFNVVRKLLSSLGVNAVSGFSEDGSQALAMLGDRAEHAVLKAHTFDQNLMNLALWAKAKIIVTTRDPRDVMVSQNERFGISFRDQIGNLSRSVATISALPEDLSVLRLRYEDGFSDDPATIQQIADFLGIPLPNDQRSSIFAALAPDMVRARISDWMAEDTSRDIREWDIATQWHPTHVGNGQSGKWIDGLPKNMSEAAERALLPFDVGGDWRASEVFWSSDLFYTTHENEVARPKLFGDSRVLIYGPYLSLPPGCWRLRPVIQVESGHSLTVKIDAFTHAADIGLLALKTVMLPQLPKKSAALEIDVVDHTFPIEFRLSSLNDGRKGSIRFDGVHLSYLGKSQARSIHPAMSASDDG